MSRLIEARRSTSTLHAGPLHVGEHGNERHLHAVVDRQQALGVEARGHRRVEPQQQLRLGPGGDGRRARRRVRGGDTVRARRPPLAEVLEGQVLERVAAPARVDQVGGEQRVEAEAREVHAQPAEHDPVALGVGRDLADGRVLEERAQQREGLGASERPLDVEAGVRERDVDRAPLGPGERDPERARTHRLGVGQHQGERDTARPAGLAGGGRDRGAVEQQPVVARAGLDLRGELARQPLELELLEERVAGAAVGLANRDRVEVEPHRHVAAQRHELLREESVGRVALQPLAVGRALHLVGVREHRPRPTRTRAPGRARPCRRCQGHRARCRPRRPRAPARRRPALGARPTSPRLPSRRGSWRPSPRGPGSAPGRACSDELQHVLVRGHDHDLEAAARRPARRASRSRRPPRSRAPRRRAGGRPRRPAGCRAAARRGRRPSSGGWPCTPGTGRGGTSCPAGRRARRRARASRPPGASAAWW